MMELIELFNLPFMQRAVIAGVVLAAVLPLFGVFVTLRRMAFFGDGVAHASLSGIAIGVLTGFHPFSLALFVGTVLGGVIYVLSRKTTISSDALIGVFFTGGMAAGIVLLSTKPGFQPDLISFMFGSILSIGSLDVWLIGLLGMSIFLLLLLFVRYMLLISFDRETAWLYGVRTEPADFLFHVLLAVTIVLGVKLLGIILVSALLLIPPTIAKLLSSSFKQLILLSILSGQVMVIFGLLASAVLDLPSGGTIVLFGVIMFALAMLYQFISGLIFQKG